MLSRLFPKRPYPVIDAHCHAGTGDGLTGPWDTRAPLGEYMKQAAYSGITHTVVFAAFHSDYNKANREVYRLVRKDLKRLSGFVFIHCKRNAGEVHSMVKQAVTQYGFKGIKVHRYDARITRELCEAARAFRVPVLYDVMGETHAVELLANEYPDVNFIIPHLGTFSDSWKVQLTMLDPLARYPNIYTDTSGVRRFDLLKEAVKRAGAHKFLFGSDGPWLHPGVELSKVYALRLPEKQEALIAGGNYLRLVSQVRTRTADIPQSDRIRSELANANPPQEYRDPWTVAGLT